jgi:hypothetical protein
VLCHWTKECLQLHNIEATISKDSTCPKFTFLTVISGVSPYNLNEQKTGIVYTMDYCVPCNRYFASKEALEQHERDSPLHNKTFHCQDCNSSFGSNKKLKNHRRFCQTSSGWPLDPVDTSLYQGRDEDASSNTWPRSPTIDPRSLLQQFARMFVSMVPPTITTHPQIAREHVPEPTQETREFFTFPELHPSVADAVIPEISSTWFNEDDNDNNFNYERLTHVMGRFLCKNNSCKKQFWDSRKVSIEIRGYNNNRYSAIVYNQRCKSCNRLGTFELNERSYTERVAYRLKKWAGVEIEAPPFNGNDGLPHEWAYCEGCKRGRCREGDGVELY